MASRPSVEVFAVEDTAVQLTWRGVPAGALALAVTTAGSDRPVAPGRTVAVDGGPGAAVLADLPPGRDLVVTATPAGRRSAAVRLPVRTPPRLPGAELARVATISDLHLGAEVFGHWGTIEEHPVPEVHHPERCAEAAVDEAVAWGAGHLVAKGDLTNHGRVEQWRAYADLVARSPIPVDALPGNHDRAFRPDEPGLRPEVAAATFGLSLALPVLVRDLDGIRLVLVDTTTGGRNLGHVETFTDEVVQAVADADPHRAVLVLLHHQLHRHLVAEGWPIGIGHHESTRFLRRLGSTGRRVLVTSGHTHRHRRWVHAGVTATQVGSTKDYPGVWAGYVVHEGGLRQVVRRVARPDILAWTDHTRRAALGAWRWVSPGPLGSRCFDLTWPAPAAARPTVAPAATAQPPLPSSGASGSAGSSGAPSPTP